ncbi:MAG TPA: single-stranded DNA-binding protein [Bryobacteraceae bacterium]|nr:single-stranded DNA-binding protein [Bryobacteraceae bacterium]HPT28665.1 single-stranded DNA-binding protein [Bryobacteraceae bacterium]
MAGRSVNKVILIGHLGKDAETRFTTSGTALTRFTVATNRRVKDSQTGDWRDETDWHNIAMWRNENLGQYLTKGKQVFIEGQLRSRSYDDKDGQKKYVTEVVVDEIILLGGGGGRGDDAGGSWGDASQRSPANRPAQKPAGAPAEPEMPPELGDDDVPF